MKDDTVIYDAEPDDSPDPQQNEENAQQFDNPEQSTGKKNAGNYVKIGVASALGLAGGVLASRFAFSDNPVVETEDYATEIEILADTRIPIATGDRKSVV